MIASKHAFFILIAALTCIHVQAQVAGSSAIALNDLTPFKEPGKNWQIVSGAIADFNKPSMLPVKGTGAIVHTATGNGKSDLVTLMESGDLELELDMMLAKNTQAAILLQGRYELQLNDSWAGQNSGSAVCGAIGERWDESRPDRKGYEGVPPSMNICRAPGLWQHLSIKFRAPRKNDKGEKAQNAVFEEVMLNGTVVQSQVQVSGPTKNALYKDEKPAGPLVFQAQGAFAVKNIHYRQINPLQAALKNLTYKYYKGDFNETFPDLAKYTVAGTDTLSTLTGNLNRGDEIYTLDVTGSLEVSADDHYTFALLTNGLGRLYIDNQLVIDRITNRWNHRFYTKQIDLSKGAHPVRVVYVKNVGNVKPGLALTIKGANTDPVNLHDMSSAPLIDFTNPVVLTPEGKPYLLRSFLNFGNKKLTHTISVGDPRHVNYSYDLKQGALIQAWRGDFLDVTNMWVERGEPQLALPLGSLIILSDAPAFAVLANVNDPWPDSIAFDDIQRDGYVLDEQRSPTFQYKLNSTVIADKIVTAEEGRSLSREITVTNPPANFYCRIAAAGTIEKVADGVYRIDDQSYYIRIDKRYKPLIRQMQKNSELIVPVNTGGPFNYFLTW